MNTQQLKDLRNALSCWQDDYDRDDDKEQYDMFGAAIDAVSRLEKAERERDELRADNEKLRSDRAGLAREANAFEAELARRDAAASEPVGSRPHFELVMAMISRCCADLSHHRLSPEKYDDPQIQTFWENYVYSMEVIKCQK